MTPYVTVNPETRSYWADKRQVLEMDRPVAVRWSLFPPEKMLMSDLVLRSAASVERVTSDQHVLPLAKCHFR